LKLGIIYFVPGVGLESGSPEWKASTLPLSYWPWPIVVIYWYIYVVYSRSLLWLLYDDNVYVDVCSVTHLGTDYFVCWCILCMLICSASTYYFDVLLYNIFISNVLLLSRICLNNNYVVSYYNTAYIVQLYFVFMLSICCHPD